MEKAPPEPWYTNRWIWSHLTLALIGVLVGAGVLTKEMGTSISVELPDLILALIAVGIGSWGAIKSNRERKRKNEINSNRKKATKSRSIRRALEASGQHPAASEGSGDRGIGPSAGSGPTEVS